MDGQLAYYGVIPECQKDEDRSLGDEFAMAALQMKHVQDYGAMTAEDMANRAYQLADAMLAARKESHANT